MKRTLLFMFMTLMLVCFTGCDDKKVNTVPHETEIILTEDLQDYDTLGYYEARYKTGLQSKLPYLKAEIKDLVTGKIIPNMEVRWYIVGGSTGIGKFYPNSKIYAYYEPALDSAPRTVEAYVLFPGNAKYHTSIKDFIIKQNY